MKSQPIAISTLEKAKSAARTFFTKQHEVSLLPNLIEVQLDSYKWFVEKGLKELLGEINPIRDFTGKNLELFFGDYFFDKSKYDEFTSRERNTTFEAPLYVSAKLINKATGKTKTQDVYFGDFNIEVSRKLSHKFKVMLIYANQIYNKAIVQVEPGVPKIYSQIGMTELSYKISSSKSIRMELQHLYTKQDSGSWAMGLIEYGAGEHWLLSAQEQYNYGNRDPERRLSYYNATVVYVKSGTRIALGYGRTREGIFCVGGVCRNVPASNGLVLSVTSSF